MQSLNKKRYFTDNNEIDEVVLAWHQGLDKSPSLAEALGWTPEEYARWVEDPDKFPRK